jgi:exodeoxyribonuclease VII large subunit
VDIYGVSQVCSYLRESLEVDPLLQDLWVEGEVSNLTVSTAGHCYFSLKDAASQLRCVLFRGRATAHTVRPTNGAAVIVHGRIGIYEPQGSLQLYVDLVQPEGVGLLRMRFEALRATLEREGLFDPARKRHIPAYPRRIGVVTSPTGAVLHDIIHVALEQHVCLQRLV